VLEGDLVLNSVDLVPFFFFCQVSKEGKKVFKKFVKEKGGIMPSILAFWLLAFDFSQLSPSDEDFSKDCKAIYKK
jgi:hypothetical protein